MNDIVTYNLKKKYASGERNFANIDLSNLDLKGIDLRGTNLSNANLQQADLSNINLQESYLDGANLDRTNLTAAKLDRVSFKKAKLLKSNLDRASVIAANFDGAKIISCQLQKANLTEANFSKAYLTISHFEEAILDNACFKGADLNGAYFERASFNGSDLREIHLIDKSHLKVKGAYYNELTKFDASLNPADIGMQVTVKPSRITIEDLLEIFNSLTQSSNQYLGTMMTIKYWESSKPNAEWVQQFKIDDSARITFAGNATELIAKEEFQLYQSWSQAFIKSCSRVIQNFSALVA